MQDIINDACLILNVWASSFYVARRVLEALI